MRKSAWLDPARHRWGAGPWEAEPDHLEWAEGSIYCVIQRTPMGTFCGYVGIPHGHPLYGASYKDDRFAMLDVHGGLSFSSRELPGTDKPFSGHLWWLGFHCANVYDYVPDSELNYGTKDIRAYKDRAFVVNEVNGVARWMKKYLTDFCGNE